MLLVRFAARVVFGPKQLLAVVPVRRFVSTRLWLMSNRSDEKQPDIFDFFDRLKAPSQRVASYQLVAGMSGRQKHAESKPTMQPSPSSISHTTSTSAIAEPATIVTASAKVHNAEKPPPPRLPDGLSEEDLCSGSFGEDAYFIRNDAIGVADGVGEWVPLAGFSSQMHSRLLMHYVSSQIESLIQEQAVIKPQQLLEYAAAQTASIRGSSTVLVAILRENNLEFAQIGDCGALVIHDGRVIYRTSEQQHYFDFPYQLGSTTRTKASDAITSSVQVTRGDIIILGSDGLFDNLFENEILDIIKKYSVPPSPTVLPLNPQNVSIALTREAYDASIDRRRPSPFEQHAIQNGVGHEGGKIDDIVVVVAVVVEAEDSPDRR